jgi:RNA polymerase-binding transcription factor DksA
VARLKALPYTTVCIACRQKQETSGIGTGEDSENWETVFEYEGANSDRELTMRDIDIEVE